jgi:hypothetical protein
VDRVFKNNGGDNHVYDYLTRTCAVRVEFRNSTEVERIKPKYELQEAKSEGRCMWSRNTEPECLVL